MAGGWIKLYRAILDDPVWTTATSDQKAVLVTVLLLASHEPRQWAWEGRKFEIESGQFVTSLANIAEKARVSIKSVRSAIGRFEKLGFLENKSAKTGRLISIRNWNSYQDSMGPLGKQVGIDRAKLGHLSKTGQGKKQLLNNQIDVESGFDIFWQGYPRKVGKQGALKAWIKLKPSCDLQKIIIEAVAFNKDSDQWQKDGGRYIPHPSTWLNGRRWEDEICNLSQNHSPAELDQKHQEASAEVARRYGLS